MEWETLTSLATSCAALPKEEFNSRFPAPFLLELNPLGGEVMSAEEADFVGVDSVHTTRGFNPEQVMKQLEVAPTLDKSKLIHFGSGKTFAVGRSSECDIHCNYGTVSKRHCKFYAFGNTWTVSDTDSHNGTYLNGRQLGPGKLSPLSFGTKVVLGQAQFLFLSSTGTYELIQELSREPRIRPRSRSRYQTEFKRAGSSEAFCERFPGPFLVVQAPKGKPASAVHLTRKTITMNRIELNRTRTKEVTDAIFDLSKHHLVRIGRASVTQIHLPLGTISTLHAALVREDQGQWVIQDLGAKNGTYLQGLRLEDRVPLDSGTELVLGNIDAIFLNTEDLLTYIECGDTLA